MTGASHPASVIAAAVGDWEDLQEAFDDTTARRDDAFWARSTRGPFTWSKFTGWWIARRFIMPRDVRKG